MEGVRFRLLGPVGVWENGRRLGPSTAQQRTVLAMLLLEPGRVVSVERLVTALWDTLPPESARNGVQRQIYKLRQLLSRWSQIELTTLTGGYRLKVESPECVDLHMFRAMVREARGSEAAVARKLLRSGLDLWQGTALADISSSWLADTVAPALHEERLIALEELAALDLRHGRAAEVINTLSAVVPEHPLRESLLHLMLSAMHQGGRRVDALTMFRRVRQQFVDQLGIEPGERLRRLHLAILNDEGGAGERRPAEHPAAEHRAAARPRTLPPDTEYFVGRDAEMSALDALVPESADGQPGSPTIGVIMGAGGAGKTALAVRWAHRMSDRFPDGQLYVNLRGFGPTEGVLAPADVLRTFLDALQVPKERFPSTVEGRIGLYRSLLANRRMLILLDNARDADQVRPLLPNSSGCMVLVTSRSGLTGLVVADGARLLPLDLLAPGEAWELLARRLGHSRMAQQPDIVKVIIARCAGLPLALAIVAASAVNHPARSLDVTGWASEQPWSGTEHLDTFDTGDSGTDLRTVFSWSYRTLSPEAARLFRLMGLRDCPDIATEAVASLAGLPVPPTRRLLTELTRAHLVSQRSPDRYTCHDLLWAYARELAETHDPPADRRDAVHRLLDHYLHSA
jgi:DNA-binding SARP family transcriptional activator